VGGVLVLLSGIALVVALHFIGPMLVARQKRLNQRDEELAEWVAYSLGHADGARRVPMRLMFSSSTDPRREGFISSIRKFYGDGYRAGHSDQADMAQDWLSVHPELTKQWMEMRASVSQLFKRTVSKP